jgi:tetratricopeptide (TPR) repeat protein
VSNRQNQVGKGEMRADINKDLERPTEALIQYEIALKTDPNRFNGLYGAAQAATQAQQKDKAATYYAQLLKNCAGVHSDRAELVQAKTLLAAN